MEREDVFKPKSEEGTFQPVEPDFKNYSPVFWKYFWIGVLLNIISRGVEGAGGEIFWVVFLILAGIYVYKFSTTINEAMLSIGKKTGGHLGYCQLFL